LGEGWVRAIGRDKAGNRTAFNTLASTNKLGAAGQYKVGKLVLDPHVDPSPQRPKGIRPWRVNPADRHSAAPVKAKPALARIVVTESGLSKSGSRKPTNS
jgi:hypothetical protein